LRVVYAQLNRYFMETATTPAVLDDTARLRASLHRFVDETDDAAVLQALLTILANTQPAPSLTDKAVRLEDLPPAERAAVEAGLRDIEAGRVRPHAEVWAELQAEFGQVKS